MKHIFPMIPLHSATLTLHISFLIHTFLYIASVIGCLVSPPATHTVPLLLYERLSGIMGRLEANVSHIPALGPFR